MEIINETGLKQSVTFRDLRPGSVFEFDSKLFLKFNTTTTNKTDNHPNAVDLYDGIKILFMDETEVFPVRKAKLIYSL